MDELATQGVAYVPFFPLGGFSRLQSSELDAIAASVRATPMQVALAWLLQRAPNVLLIPGTSSVKHLRENFQAVALQISPETIAELDSIAGGHNKGPKAMKDKANRHAENASDEWFINRNCMNCSAARTVAPGLIVLGGGQSVFARKPETPDELMMAWRARLLCPTAAVRTESRIPPPVGVFPEEMTQGVYRLGYNAKSSYGAHSFLIRRPDGNAIVDAPRWTNQVVSTLEEAGGLSDILLTHKDDVADADRYAKHFSARVSIHKADRRAARYATQIFEGRDPMQVHHDLLAIPVPGHTKGSVVYLWNNRCLFTGDSLSWSFADNDLEAFRDFCWYSWDEQRRSLARLLNYNFEWVLAGHGGSHGAPAEEMRSRLQALVERMN